MCSLFSVAMQLRLPVVIGGPIRPKSHEHWIAEQRFNHDGDRMALAEYQLAAHSAEQRVLRLTTALAEAARGWRFEPVVAALRALRGIDTIGAIGLVTEIATLAASAALAS